MRRGRGGGVGTLCLSQWRGGEYFTCSNDFDLFSLRLGRGEGGQHPVGIRPPPSTVQSKCFDDLLFISPFFPRAACPPGTWGPRCENSCPCLHSASCDPVSGECTCGPGWWGNRCHLKCDAFRCPKEKFLLNFSYNFFILFCQFGNSKHLWKKRENLFFVLTLFIINLIRISDVELHKM